MRSQFHLVRAGLAAAVLSLPHLAFAASATWTGGGTTGDFTDGSNWSTGAAPGSTSPLPTPAPSPTPIVNTDVATFNNATNTKVNVSTRYLNQLIFDTGAGAFSFQGGTLFVGSFNNLNAFQINSGVTKSQTIYSNVTGTAASLGFNNASTTSGVIYNLRGDLAGRASGGSVNLAQGVGSGAVVWGSIKNNGSGVTALGATDFNAGFLVLRSKSSTYTGATTVQRGSVFFDTVGNVGGGGSALGAPTTVATGTINVGFSAKLSGLYYTGSGSTTDRIIQATSGQGATGADLANYGTGALVWNGNFLSASNGAATLVLSGFNTAENRFAGAIKDNGALTTSLVKNNSGTWNISGANTYTGSTTINEGLLRADFSAVGAPATDIINSASTLVMNGGTFAVRGATSGTSSQTLNGFTLNRGGSTLVADGNGGAGTTLSLGAITRASGSALNVQTTPGGVVTTTSSSVTNGVLTDNGVAYATANGTDWATLSGSDITAVTSYQTSTDPTSWAATDNVSVNTSPASAVTTRTVNTMRLNGAADLTIASGNTLTLGAGGLLFTGTGSQSISGGTLTNGATGNELVIRQNNTSSPVTVSSIISGTGAVLTKTGAGTLTLSGANTYTGNTVITEGVLKGTITSSSLVNLSGGVWGLTSDLTGNIGTSGSSKVAWSNSGGFAAYAANRTVSLNSGGTLTWGNTASFLKTGQALILGATDADATLIWTNAINIGTTQSAYMREIQVNDGSAAVDAEMTGVLSVAAGLNHAGIIKTGTGTLRLTAANTYDGPTIISAGTLIVNGSIGNSMLTTVRSGATLAGTGSSAQIELMAGGAMSPGDGGIGTFSTSQNGNSDFNWHGEASGDFAQMKFELSNIDATSDRLALGSGLLNKSDGIVFKFDFLGTGLADTTYTLISFGGSSNFSAGDFSYSGLAGGLTGQFTLTDSALLFTTSAIPEPSQVFLIIAGLAVVVFFRRSVGCRSA